jgi:hypothetical protein
MRKQQRIFAVAAFGVAAVLGAIYFEKRDLWGRYQAYQHRSEQIRQAEHQVRLLEATLKSAQEQADNSAVDPVEVEAAIRRVKRLVREGERIYHVEEVESSGAAADGT